jgi:hypothetical protein
MESRRIVRLPDGSRAMLEPGARLTYRASFFPRPRLLTLEGEAPASSARCRRSRGVPARVSRESGRSGASATRPSNASGVSNPVCDFLCELEPARPGNPVVDSSSRRRELAV